MTEAAADSDLEAQALAERAIKEMYERDAASRGLGMLVLSVSPGRAEVRMKVRPDMLNGHQSCHGGFIFTLADSAFAFACNSRNASTVAAHCQIDFLAPGREGDVLTAEAVERSLNGRTGVYDISVHNQDGRLIALFRGKSHRITGTVIPSESQ